MSNSSTPAAVMPAMQEVTHYPHGAFSWAALDAHDVAAAKQFYGALFGWEYTDVPMGDGEMYTLGLVNGKSVVGMAPMQPERRAAGLPPTWDLNITVDSVDATQAQVAAAGGTPLGEPFDVFDQGRMAVAQDPTGAMIIFWEPRVHIGSAYTAGPGVPVWRELYTSDASAAAAFYKSLLGWAIAMNESPGGTMASCFVNDQPVAMIMPVTPEMGPMPTSWIVYFGVADVHAAAARVQELGGQVNFGPVVMSGYPFAHCTDPQGGHFSIVAPPQE
jgi:uncharacterized protein